MINAIKHIPTTSASYPFASAVKKCDLDSCEYEEKEYLMYGTANIYKNNENNKLDILYSDAEYVNRFIIRAPKVKENFSGNVVIEILNPTAGFDIDRIWVLTHKQIIRNGDIYVGITSKPDVIDALLEFDGARYSEISWKSPLGPTEIDPGDGMTPPIMRPQDEMGLFWDMLTDLSSLLRKTDDINPIANFKCKKIVLSGWSQSACYLIRYVNSIAYSSEVRKDRPIFDGYFVAGAVHSLPIPVSQRDYFVKKNDDNFRVTYVKEPYVSIQTESENASFGGYEAYRDNSDDPDFLYRIYEIPGSSHDSRYSLLDYYLDDKDMEIINRLPEYTGDNEYPNDYPYEIPFSAIYRNFINWVVDGVAPPCVPRIPVKHNGENAKDVFGNTAGGVRTPLIDYPTCRYYSYSDLEDSKKDMFGIGRNPLFGHVEQFSKNFLIELYGSLENYKILVTDSTYEQVRKGFIVQEDAQEIINIAVKLAEKRGLK